MAEARHIARDITYAHSAETRGGRAMIRFMENSTGRLRLIRRARGYETEIAAGRDFWQVMVERYGLSLTVMGGSLDNIPRSGPLVMIAKSQATVVPHWFEGTTSRLFQIASHLHTTLRMGLLIKEFHKRVDTPVEVIVGETIGRDILDPLARDSKAMMDFLRKATYGLGPHVANPMALGYEFEERHRAQ